MNKKNRKKSLMMLKNKYASDCRKKDIYLDLRYIRSQDFPETRGTHIFHFI